MGTQDNAITLPEITIVGSADTRPTTASDWWCEGFIDGFNAPDTPAARPLMINDELAAMYLSGYASGQQVNREVQADFEDRSRASPQLQPDLGGEAYAEVEKRYAEAWESVFHQHPPHTEVEGEPGPTLVRPNIVIVPE
jgi:hypothetical protein